MFYKHLVDWLSFLHFYLYVAGRLFAVSYYRLLLLLLLTDAGKERCLQGQPHSLTYALS